MDWTTYVEASAKTVIYPQTSPEDSIRYITAGLLGEMGEMFNDCKKLLRGECPFTIKDVLLNEGGDVYWYLAAFYREYGIKVRGIELPPCPEVVVSKTPIAMVVDLLVAIQLGCSHIAETVLETQYQRPLSIGKKAVLTSQCDQVMVILDALCAVCGILPDRVREYNIEKLTARQVAGTLHNHNETDPEK